MRVRLSQLLKVVPVALAAAGDPANAADYYLKIDGIPGESTSKVAKDDIEVLSFSFGVVVPNEGGAATGKPTFQPFSIQTTLSKASPPLYLACAQGRVLKTVTLRGFLALNAGTVEFYDVTLRNARVTSITGAGASGGGNGTESISFAYETITWSYSPANAKGTLDPAIVTGWDIPNGKAL